jgi:hypothetical protein
LFFARARVVIPCLVLRATRDYSGTDAFAVSRVPRFVVWAFFLGAFGLALACGTILLIAGETDNWFALTRTFVSVKVLIGRTLLVLLAFASTSWVVIPAVIFRTVAFIQTLAFTSLLVVIGKGAGTLVAGGLVLDNSIDSCSWCVFTCIINSYLYIVLATFKAFKCEFIDLLPIVASVGRTTINACLKLIISCNDKGSVTRAISIEFRVKSGIISNGPCPCAVSVDPLGIISDVI